MPTYQEYQDQIAELQVLAEQARQSELVEAKQRIQEMMKASGLTIADLQESKRSGGSKKQNTVAAKYKDPESGQTWTGRGRAPRWLAGRDKNKFLIK